MDTSEPKGNNDFNSTNLPSEGLGLNYQLNKLQRNFIFFGKVNDTYPTSGSCRVSIPGIISNVPCVFASTAMGVYFGARSVAPPCIGTPVIVFIPQNSTFGYILATAPDLNSEPTIPPANQLISESGTSTYAVKDAFNHRDWNNGKKLPAAGAGTVVDVFSGDQGTINDLGCFVGVLRAMALFKGSELAKIEAFVLDDLLNVVGHNLNIYTSQGEKKVFNDHGRISEEEQLSLSQAESMGAVDVESTAFDEDSGSLRYAPDKSALKEKIESQVLKPRWKKWRGWLGDFYQSFICRPASGLGSLTTASKPDMGLYQKAITISGQHIERSIVGGGFHKSLQIAVPKKKLEHNDPAGDKEVDEVVKEAFIFDTDHPMAIGAQSRDYFAYLFNKELPANRASLEKDWVTPDESNCIAPGTEVTIPGTGDFFREFPQMEEVMEQKDGLDNDVHLGPKKFSVGEAFCGIMPDGSILLKNAWGDSIELRAGHLVISVSKSATTTAGGSIVNMAGDDIIQKAKNSIDITSSAKQIRIKAEQDMLIHSKSGGILVSAPTQSAITEDKKGEEQHLSGIVLKSAPGVLLHSDNIILSASSKVQIKGQENRKPNILVECQSQIQRVTGQVIIKTGEEFTILSSSGVQTTGSFQADKSLFVRESISYGGGSGRNSEVSKTPTLKSQLSGIDKDEIFIPYPYLDKDIDQLKFSYRSTLEYGTNEGKWYASDWQRTMTGLQPWTENDIDYLYPYPGEKHYSGEESIFTYTEVNVENTGKTKERGSMSGTPGKFVGSNFSTFKIPASI